MTIGDGALELCLEGEQEPRNDDLPSELRYPECGCWTSRRVVKIDRGCFHARAALAGRRRDSTMRRLSAAGRSEILFALALVAAFDATAATRRQCRRCCHLTLIEADCRRSVVLIHSLRSQRMFADDRRFDRNRRRDRRWI